MSTPKIGGKRLYRITSFSDFRNKLDISVDEIEEALPTADIKAEIRDMKHDLSELQKEDQGFAAGATGLSDIPAREREHLIHRYLSESSTDIRADILASRPEKYLIIEGQTVDFILELSEPFPQEGVAEAMKRSPEKEAV